jgi:uncharacterized protein YebE (UPF0316 family)
MDLSFLTGDSTLFTWVILPLLIFISRIADQSIGTLRLIFISKGYKYIAPVLGFFEVIIWLLAVTQIFKQLDNFFYYIAYGAGFAAGNFVGMILEEKLALGMLVVRIIPKKDTSDLIDHLKEKNFGITYLDAQGSRGPVNIIFSIIQRRQLHDLIAIINQYNPNAFYSVEEVKSVSHGVFRPAGPVLSRPKFPGMWRKSK